MGKFVKGQIANPNGRPKKEWTWAHVLQEAVDEATQSGEPVKKVLARALIREGLRGNVHAIKAVMERMDGLPQQDITSAGEKIEITFHSSLKQAKQEGKAEE